jgi:hypothetical protein
LPTSFEAGFACLPKGIDNYGYFGYNGYAGYETEVGMADATKRSRYFLDIDPELRNRVKAVAALQGKTMRQWLVEAIIEKLEDEIDAREGLAALGDVEGAMSLRDYLVSQEGARRV